MKRIPFLVLAVLLTGACQDVTQPSTGATPKADPLAAEAGTGVIHVAPPTGNPAVDRSSIQAAIAHASPGDVIQFAPGTYVLGLETFPTPFIQVGVPGVTLEGHPRGTTLFGRELPEDFDPGPGGVGFVVPIGGLMLTASDVTVRNLTFESFWTALDMGGLNLYDPSVSVQLGGFRVENSTFRNSLFGVLAVPGANTPSYIEDNKFINVGGAIYIAGRKVHAIRNRVRAPDPEAVPFIKQPFWAAHITNWPLGLFCEDNIIENNTATGISDGVILAAEPGEEAQPCRHNVIRENRFTDMRVFTEFDSGTLAAVLSFGGVVEDNFVVQNRLDGSAGVGIVTIDAVRTHIVRNTLRNIAASPFGEDYILGEWSGIGVLLQGGGSNNVLLNTFRDIANWDVVLLSDHNLVVTRNPHDRVLDLGQDNTVVGRRELRGRLPGYAERAARQKTEKKAELMRRFVGGARR